MIGMATGSSRKLSSLYQNYLVEQFVDEIVYFYKSTDSREELTVGLQDILPGLPDRCDECHALFFRLAIAKLVLESKTLTDTDPENRVSRPKRGRAVKKACYHYFLTRFFRDRHVAMREDERSYRLCKLVPQYEQTLRHSGKVALGELLLSYFEERFELPLRLIRRKRAEQLIKLIEQTGVQDFWGTMETLSRTETVSPI